MVSDSNIYYAVVKTLPKYIQRQQDFQAPDLKKMEFSSIVRGGERGEDDMELIKAHGQDIHG